MRIEYNLRRWEPVLCVCSTGCIRVVRGRESFLRPSNLAEGFTGGFRRSVVECGVRVSLFASSCWSTEARQGGGEHGFLRRHGFQRPWPGERLPARGRRCHHAEDRGSHGVRAELAVADADSLPDHVGVHHHENRRDGIAHRRFGAQHRGAREGDGACGRHASVAVQLFVPRASRWLWKGFEVKPTMSSLVIGEQEAGLSYIHC